MTGVWLQEGVLAVRDDLPVPSPAPGEALVRVDLAGICGTDHELVAGYAGFHGIPGHEFGRVLHGPEALIGKRVVADINVGCGVCAWRRDVGPAHCRPRTVLGIRGRHGAFAEVLSLPAANLHVVPAHVPALATHAVRPHGTLVLKSTYAAGPVPGDPTRLVIDEIRVLGSRCGPIEHALRLLAADDLGVEERVDARYPLEHAGAAFARSGSPGTLKVLLAP